MQIHFATFTVHLLLLVIAIHDPGQFNKYAHMVENQIKFQSFRSLAFHAGK